MRILFPPRPKNRILAGELPVYERSNRWVAQRKFNGQRNPIYISSDKQVQFFNYGAPHANYVPPEQLIREFSALQLEDGKDYWLDSELLDKKTKDPRYKDRVILFDVLHVGKHLFGGPTFLERLAILAEICRNPTTYESTHGIALQVTEHIWLAETFDHAFSERFTEILQYDEIEGLVLKRKDSKLDNIGIRKHEVAWQIRCRKPHAGGNYNF
jgi:ATP-dependent DNA ligase